MSPWNLAGIVLAVIAGALLPLQALINAQLGQRTTGALFASFASFLVGTLALGIALLAMRTAWPTTQQAGGLPVWAWLGGVIGALFVVSATVLVPRLGAAALICLAVYRRCCAGRDRCTVGGAAVAALLTPDGSMRGRAGPGNSSTSLFTFGVDS